VLSGERRAVLMDAPPPHEDPRPFVAVAEWLAEAGLSAPKILARDLEEGLLLLDDLGTPACARRSTSLRIGKASSTSLRSTCSFTCTPSRRCPGCARMG
jgi:aminoglycoside/choline kinase family phosphotransferase